MRKLIYVFLCLLTIGLCGACGQANKVADEDDSMMLKLGVMPTVDCLPFYYADSVGLFDSLGVDVRLITFGAAIDADTAFWGGGIDGVVSDLVKECVWRERGDSVHVAMCGDLRLWLVTSQTARIVRAESMKEKIVGITRNSAVDFFLDRVLEEAKFKSIDVNKPQINDIRLRTLMVDQNQYDGAILPEPYASEAVARGARRLNGTEDLKLNGMMCVMFGDSIYKKRKQDVEKIVRAYDMAVEALNVDTIHDVLGFLPQRHIMQMPDSLYIYTPLRKSSQPSDSLLTVIKQWAKGRELIK